MGPLFFLGGVWLVIMLPLLTIVGGPFAQWHHMTATDYQNPLVFQSSVKAIVVLPCFDHSI